MEQTTSSTSCNCEKCPCQKKRISVALILGISFIIGAAIISFVLYQTRVTEDTLQVTGSAKKTIISDVVKWNSTFSRSVDTNNLKEGYAQMASDLEKITNFLKDNGIDISQITISPIYPEERYDYSKSGNNFLGYTLRQNIQVQSTEVQKITDLAKNTYSLIEQGVVLSTQSLEYYYTKLPEVRVDLLTDAVKDAQNRATKIAESSGQKIGLLKSASMGVVQVLPVNSVNVSDYGAYDTSSIEKEVMITVRTTFRISK
ncbi:MAG: SIMPL domain-containing protein [Candidatus Pacebacteria bacterium]|nr:SIMPL domain-containing protein [Candidatus Paceibacterota bacterium]